MNRFTYGFGLRIDRAHLLILAFAFLAVTILGCGGGGISIIPLGAKLQNADSAFDEAETVEVRDEDQEKMEKNRQRQQELYDRAMALYLEVIERDTKGKWAQRAHFQIAKIYKRRYDWDKATEHYQAIVALDPTGYYANEAKAGTANIRKNREIIKTKRAEYQNYKAIYDNSPTDETFNIAAEALYEVARAYESLENYTEAIRNYERMVEEFPEHSKASQAQFQVGNVYFYTLYDYLGGWPAFVAVTEKFEDSYEASQAGTLLKQTAEILTEINFLKDEIDKYRNKKAVQYQQTGRKITPADMWVMGMGDQVVQNFQQIANNWEKLRNYPRAINAYKTLARDLSHKKFAAADALYRTGTLYQQNGEYERAIEAYQNLFELAPESTWRNEAVYQQAVCYRSIREFGAAYEGFKAYMSITKGDVPYLREAEQIVRQYELDQDEDGYKFYEEQEAGTSDQDASSHPGMGS
ncbi:MAG: tetratricopeptide repeat protein [Candidatus Poribacteria bacterium]|nr:tetratricopeptide repeat protein [Candidatus Poribacteria bacterium]